MHFVKRFEFLFQKTVCNEAKLQKTYVKIHARNWKMWKISKKFKKKSLRIVLLYFSAV